MPAQEFWFSAHLASSAVLCEVCGFGVSKVRFAVLQQVWMCFLANFAVGSNGKVRNVVISN